MKKKAIETAVGIIKGRDAIFLDEVQFIDLTDKVKLSGEFNGSLLGNPRVNEYIGYDILFFGILALKMVELDSWEPGEPESSFDEVVESGWVKELGGEVSSDHKHYVFQTYDAVFEIVCSGYELKILA